MQVRGIGARASSTMDRVSLRPLMRWSCCTGIGWRSRRGCSSWRRCSRTCTRDGLPRPGPVSRRVLPGMERAVRVGGVGTPRVAEFAYAELGARLEMRPWSARRLVADALDVRHRLPLIWARLRAPGEARVGHARLVAAKTRHLSVEAAARGCGDGDLRGRVAALGPVRGPAGRQDRGRRPRRWPRSGRPRGSPSSSRNGPGPPSTAPPGSTSAPPSG